MKCEQGEGSQSLIFKNTSATEEPQFQPQFIEFSERLNSAFKSVRKQRNAKGKGNVGGKADERRNVCEGEQVQRM